MNRGAERRPRLVSLACGVLPEFGPLAIVDAAAKAGFPAAGLRIGEDWTDGTTKEVKRAIADAGIAILDVEVVWILPGAPNSFHERLMEIGAELGSANVLVVSRDPDMAATAAKYAGLCALGERLGLRVALEFGLFTEVKTIKAAAEIITQAHSPASALLVDALHLARSGGTPADVVELPQTLFSYAQLCDGKATGPAPDDSAGILREALDGRLQTGEGGLRLRELVEALPPLLPVSIELRSKQLRDAFPDPIERSRTVASASFAFIDAADRDENALTLREGAAERRGNAAEGTGLTARRRSDGGQSKE